MFYFDRSICSLTLSFRPFINILLVFNRYIMEKLNSRKISSCLKTQQLTAICLRISSLLFILPYHEQIILIFLNASISLLFALLWPPHLLKTLTQPFLLTFPYFPHFPPYFFPMLHG